MDTGISAITIKNWLACHPMLQKHIILNLCITLLPLSPPPPPSLGVVFVSVSDTTELANDNLDDVAKELGLFDHTHYELQQEEEEKDEAVGGVNDLDFELAQRIQESEQEAQLERDRELAEQLQMKEHTYRTPRSAGKKCQEFNCVMFLNTWIKLQI